MRFIAVTQPTSKRRSKLELATYMRPTPASGSAGGTTATPVG